jgi:hypothetical protein
LSEHTGRDGIGRVDMLPLRPTRLPRSTTDRLLDTGTGPEPVRQLLAAAAAPAQAGELDGEQVARLAFTMSAGCRPLPDVAAPNSPKRTRALSWIVAAKAIAALALTAGASGVAVAATSGPFPDGPPDTSTHQQSDPHSSTAWPMVVDRARGTAPGLSDSAGRDGTESGETPTTTSPAARPDPPGSSEAAAPDEGTPPAPPTVAPGNPQHTTGPANGNKKSTAKTPPGQQQEKKKENNGNNTAGANTDHPGDSDVGDPRSDTAKQRQKAGQE